VLGAYETVRTMAEHSNHFSESFASQVKSQKRKLETIRIPFAKQERRRSNVHVAGELSVTGLGKKALSFTIDGEVYNSTELILEVIAFFDGIKPSDIMKPLPVGEP
jgi:hypothetical protein